MYILRFKPRTCGTDLVSTERFDDVLYVALRLYHIYSYDNSMPQAKIYLNKKSQITCSTFNEIVMGLVEPWKKARLCYLFDGRVVCSVHLCDDYAKG